MAFWGDGHLEIDNNRSERSMKPYVIERENGLFAITSRGAKASAVVYSIAFVAASLKREEGEPAWDCSA